MSDKKSDIKKNNKEAFLEAMKKTYGNISQSCKLVGIDPSLPHKWKKDDKEFKAQMYDKVYENIYKDSIEEKLAKVGIIDENPTVLIFLAKTKLKDRGYIEYQRIQYTSDAPAPVSREEVAKSIDRLTKLMNGEMTVTKKSA